MDGFEVRPYDDEEVARLAAALSYTSETDSGVIVDRPQVELWFQKVDLEPRSKTPLHLDLASSEWLAEIDRLTALGATVRQRNDRHA